MRAHFRQRILGVPPLAEQHRIGAKIDELMALCDRLEASLAAGDDTRRGLLDALLAEALTWHTTRHEFISRVAETTKNPRDAQEAARHKRLETTERYMHTRRDRRWEVAHGLTR